MVPLLLHGWTHTLNKKDCNQKGRDLGSQGSGGDRTREEETGCHWCTSKNVLELWGIWQLQSPCLLLSLPPCLPHGCLRTERKSEV